MDTRFVLCDVCGSEGRILCQHVINPYEEVDHGECPECKGTGMMEVEVQPVECDDHVWQEHDVYGENCTKCPAWRDPAQKAN